MPRLPLWAAQERGSPSVLFTEIGGELRVVANWRVFCTLVVGRDPARHEAVIDTGAPTTIFPLAIWRRFAAEIEWLSFADRTPSKPATVGGVTYHYRFGRVSVRVGGRGGGELLPPLSVVAQFEQPNPAIPLSQRLTRTIVGLQFGPLEGRSLVVSPRHALAERCEAWVTDAP